MENKGAKITRIVMVLLVVFFVAICIIGGVSSGKSYNENSSKTEITEAEIIRNTDHEPGRLPTKETETEEITTEPTEPTTEVITATLGERNALRKAESYLNYTSFSKEGLRDQLEYEGFASDEIDYALDNIVVDWNEQAAAKAESYLKYSSFSREGLAGQLEYEGFTAEQIEYALTAVGY